MTRIGQAAIALFAVAALVLPFYMDAKNHAAAPPARQDARKDGKAADKAKADAKAQEARQKAAADFAKVMADDPDAVKVLIQVRALIAAMDKAGVDARINLQFKDAKTAKRFVEAERKFAAWENGKPAEPEKDDEEKGERADILADLLAEPVNAAEVFSTGETVRRFDRVGSRDPYFWRTQEQVPVTGGRHCREIDTPP